MQSSDRLPRVASIIAFVMAALTVLISLLGCIVLLPVASIPICAGIGILRKRVWSAYGFATFWFAQLLLLPVSLLRPWYLAERAPQIAAMLLFSSGFGILFLLAGRSLAASSARRGVAGPWIAVAALSVVPFFFVHTFEVPSGSMENTLLPGDSILAQMFPLRSPARGQLILFFSPRDRGVILIKRVIAVPGDHLRIASDVVILNGKPLDERYVIHQAGAVQFYPVDFPNDVELPDCAQGHEEFSRQVIHGEIVVPPQSYFVLGDNRDNSLDGRCWGFVSSSDIIGKPLVIYESKERTAEELADPDQKWLGRRRWARLFKTF